MVPATEGGGCRWDQRDAIGVTSCLIFGGQSPLRVRAMVNAFQRIQVF